jgi:hypothetical protein
MSCTTTTYRESNYSFDKNAIKKMLRKSLLPNPKANYNKEYWPKWLEDRLTTLAIYSTSDKSLCPVNEIECLRRYSAGQDYYTIAVNLRLKPQSVQVYISKALDWVVENTPVPLLANVPISNTEYRLGGCPHCKGDLFWSDADGAYWCTACSRYFDSNNNPIAKVIKPY